MMTPLCTTCGAMAIIAVLAMASNVSRVSADDFNSSVYARNASLSSNLDLFWTIDTDLGTIRVAVHAKAASGWAGLGMSEMGGMEGADIVYYETETGNITDAYAITSGMPLTDECTQDWTLVSAEVGDDGLIFEAERALDTGDSQDRVFANDSTEGTSPTMLIAAWGDSESIAYHGTNFVQGEVIMFGGDENSNVDPLIGITSNPFFEITAKNFTIPTDRTTYKDTCLTAAELPDLDEYHAIGFEAIIQNTTSKYVHHLVLAAYNGSDDCNEACNQWLNNQSQSSSYDSSSEDDSGTPSFCNFQYTFIYLWGPGIDDHQLPEDVGFKFGAASGGYTSLNIQTHYDNADGDEGVVDSSGVRMYYTEDLRPMEMGVLALGDPIILLYGKPILEGKSKATFECPGSCTGQYFEAETVTVHSHFLHMHENGQRMVTRQYREDESGNEVLVYSAEVEYYSFLQAAGYTFTVNDSMTIQKGDWFETDCHYDTALSSVSPDSVMFGDGSENEMCVHFIYYYPIQPIPVSGSCGYGFCDGNMTGYFALDADSDFNRTFGSSTSCEELDNEVQQSSSTSTLPGGLILAYIVAVTLVLIGN